MKAGWSDLQATLRTAWLAEAFENVAAVSAARVAIRFAEFVTARIDRIAGAELGAVALAAATSLATGKPFVIVRNSKKAGYGTGKLIEGRLEKGERVLLVEDVATSGGQTIEAARTLTEAGAVVDRIVAVIDRLEGVRENIEQAGIAFDSLLTTDDLGIVKD